MYQLIITKQTATAGVAGALHKQLWPKLYLYKLR
jgi:hypothetical protein